MSDKNLPPKDAGEKCNARRTDGSGYCGQPAGWGTDHNGVGRCKFHCGNTPNQEKNIIAELEDAAKDASIALRLRLKHIREKAESGKMEEVDWQEVDRISRTVFDRTDHGPTETQEVAGADGNPLEVTINRESVDE
jgi:hypothetical protein